jgi:hypothetical protein
MLGDYESAQMAQKQYALRERHIMLEISKLRLLGIAPCKQKSSRVNEKAIPVID